MGPRSPTRRPRACERRKRVGRLQEHQRHIGRRQPRLLELAQDVSMGRAALADRYALAAQIGDRLDRRIRVNQHLITHAPAVVGRHHLDLGVGRRTEDRRAVAGDREIDLSRCGGFDLRRAGGEGGERDLVGQVVQRARGVQQRLRAALLIPHVQRESGQLRERHRGGGFWAPAAVLAATRSRSAVGSAMP